MKVKYSKLMHYNLIDELNYISLILANKIVEKEKLNLNEHEKLEKENLIKIHSNINICIDILLRE